MSRICIKSFKKLLLVYFIIVLLSTNITVSAQSFICNSLEYNDKLTTLSMKRIKHFPFKVGYNTNKITYTDLLNADKYYNKINSYNKSNISFTGKDKEITKAFDVMAFKYFYYNEFDSSMIICSDGDTIVSIKKKDWNASKVLNKKIENKIKKIVNNLGLNKNMTEYEAIKRINDYLCNTISYDYTYKAVTIEEALFEGRAICCSYAATFEAIAEYVGIDVYVVESEPLNHAWNLVVINGNTYELDVCWNDFNDMSNYKYFMLSHNEMMKSHGNYTRVITKRYNLDNIGSIKYKLNGGESTSSNKNKYIVGNKQKLLTPSKNGYIFEGWYTSKYYKSGTKVTDTSQLNAKNITLYAKYNKVYHTVKYVLNNGKNSSKNLSNFYKCQDFKLKEPERKGYKFEGWYTTSNFKWGTKVTNINQLGKIKEVILYAKWSK